MSCVYFYMWKIYVCIWVFIFINKHTTTKDHSWDYTWGIGREGRWEGLRERDRVSMCPTSIPTSLFSISPASCPRPQWFHWVTYVDIIYILHTHNNKRTRRSQLYIYMYIYVYVWKEKWIKIIFIYLYMWEYLWLFMCIVVYHTCESVYAWNTPMRDREPTSAVGICICNSYPLSCPLPPMYCVSCNSPQNVNKLCCITCNTACALLSCLHMHAPNHTCLLAHLSDLLYHLPLSSLARWKPQSVTHTNQGTPDNSK